MSRCIEMRCMASSHEGGLRSIHWLIIILTVNLGALAIVRTLYPYRSSLWWLEFMRLVHGGVDWVFTVFPIGWMIVIGSLIVTAVIALGFSVMAYNRVLRRSA